MHILIKILIIVSLVFLFGKNLSFFNVFFSILLFIVSVEDDEYLVETLDNGVDYERPETPINIEPPNKMIRLDNSDKKFTIQTESTEDNLFCSSVACTLGKFSRLHNIKAKGEIMRVLEKYVELEEASK